MKDLILSVAESRKRLKEMIDAALEGKTSVIMRRNVPVVRLHRLTRKEIDELNNTQKPIISGTDSIR